MWTSWCRNQLIPDEIPINFFAAPKHPPVLCGDPFFFFMWKPPTSQIEPLESAKVPIRMTQPIRYQWTHKIGLVSNYDTLEYIKPSKPPSNKSVTIIYEF